MKKRLLSLLLLLVLAVSFTACGETGTGKGEGFSFSADCRIVVQDTALKAQGVENAVALLTEGLQKICGISVPMVTEAEAGEAGCDILVGPSQRTESAELQKTFKVNDYGYRVVSERCIVITGGCGAAVLSAAEKFCADVLGYEKGEGSPKEVTVKMGTNFIHHGEYPYASATLQGIDLKEYTVAVFSKSLLGHGQKFVEELGKYTGYALPVVVRGDLTGNEKGVFMIGSLARDGKERYTAQIDGYIFQTRTEANGGFTVGVGARNDGRYQEAIGLILESITEKVEGQAVHLTLPDLDTSYFKIEGIPQWTMKTETKETLADGVELVTRNYVDKNKKPYVTKALIVDPAKASLTMGTTNDGFEVAPVPAGTVVEHMKSAVANGKNVIAAVNADFFDLGGDNHPMGIAVKDGQLIRKASNNKGYFAVKKDGTAIIGTDSDKLKVKDLENAWGARQMIVDRGAPTNLEQGTEFSDLPHPRTLAGITKDGKIILATIDGRQPTVSNGASLANCALYMISLGAESAINLDGGGSTTMAVREGDQYNVVNNLSDGSMRRVYNSVLVIAK